jgi:O-Antigen ligase
VAVFAPLRWSMVALLCISAIDFSGGRGSFASYNVAKGLLLPVILLWRTRGYSGHRNVLTAAIAWLLLIAYVGIASFWSFFPESAVKLAIQMMGTFLTVIVMIRATKGGFLTAKTAVYAAIGALALGVCATYVTHGWGDEFSRFSAFMSAQGYAAFLVGLYCIVLCGRDIAVAVRIVLCVSLAVALVLDGSRTWFMGLILATAFSVMLSRGRAWFKICAGALSVGLIAAMIGGADTLFGILARSSAGNRIAAAVTAAYQGDRGSTGLGTFNFRREINDIAIDEIRHANTKQLLFGHGTCNGAIITGTHFHGYARMLDPNRMFHNEWLRVIYEWGLIGSACWLLFVGSLIRFAVQGFRIDLAGDAKPLLVYMPSFFVALSTENILAGSVSAVSMAFLMAIALASIPHRRYANAHRAYAGQMQRSSGVYDDTGLRWRKPGMARGT